MTKIVLEEKINKLEARIATLEWAVRQALATPMIGNLATSILEPVIKPSLENKEKGE